ncbi:MAG: hypothetical protein QF472_00720 [Candidatus Marinimicrobia bacterium]|jgi:tellurite resistance protein TehA-like permease|nr:hypothetical protein [Candidatus Neomarinimicrobiota bacterium]MDP6852451.1 hypothetical protein [Candidatus Neomarinimicrobiota bacterium]
MLGFIGFGFKLLLAAIIGGALSYVPGKSENEQKIVESSLICIFAASILGLTSQLYVYETNMGMGLGIVAVFLVITSLSKQSDFAHRMLWYFSAAVGMVLGAGLFLQAVIFAGLIYLILQNSDKVFNYLEQEKSEDIDNPIDKISN